MKVFGGPLARAGIGALMLGTLAMGALTAGQAHAMVTSCRSDPVVLLSNGATMDLSADISDDLSDVQSVTYAVHAPAGTFPIAVIGTDGLMGLLEHFTFYADNSRGKYSFDTTVMTGHSVLITGHFTELSVFGLVVGAASVTGTSNQYMHASFTSLLG